MRDLITAAHERTIVYDGGMGATLEQFELSLEDDYKLPGRCHEALILNRPDVIEGVHASMLEAGADVLETDTFQASRLKLAEWGLEAHTHEINLKAAEIARKAAGEQRFVAGSIGPTGFLPASDDPTLGKITFAELVDVFAEQATGLLAGGVDLVIIETAQDILEVKAAVFGVRRAGAELGRASRSSAACRCCPRAARCCSGTDISAVLATLEALDVDVIGLNCSTGPEDMRDAIRFLGEFSPVPVHCIPNAGLPLQGPNGETIFPEQPEPLANVLGEFVDRYGVSIVGGCCGTTPEHIRAMAERVKGKVPPRAPGAAPAPRQLDDRRHAAGAGPPPDADRRAGQLAGLAQGQGAAAGRRLRRIAGRRRGPGHRRRPRARRLRGPDRAPGRGRPDARGRQADLADPARADPGGLHRARGDRGRPAADPRPGDRQLDQPRGRPRQARPRGPARQGPRRGADRPDDRRGRDGQDRRAQARDRPADHPAVLRGARPGSRGADLRLPDLHADHRRSGVAPERRGDDRGHPPGQGRDSRGQDLAGRLQLSASASGCRRGRRSTACSCTTAWRPGSTWRWSTPTTSPPTPRSPRPNASWPTTSCSTAARTRWSASSPTSSPRGRRGRRRRSAANPTEGMEPEEALHFHILRRKKEGVEDWIDRSVEKIGAVPTLNTVLLPAMKEVGDKFGAGELILPFVLQSAEVMKRAVAQLEHYLDKLEGYTKGTVVIATVFGDVHDIGKSLVNTILTNNGYTVVDLGKQVPISNDPRRRGGARRHGDRPLGAARLDLQADAGLRPGAARSASCRSRC